MWLWLMICLFWLTGSFALPVDQGGTTSSESYSLQESPLSPQADNIHAFNRIPPSLPSEMVQHIWDLAPLQSRARLRAASKQFNPLRNHSLASPVRKLSLKPHVNGPPYQRVSLSTLELFIRQFPRLTRQNNIHLLYRFCIQYANPLLIPRFFPTVADCFESADTSIASSFSSNPLEDSSKVDQILAQARLQILYDYYESRIFFRTPEMDATLWAYFTQQVTHWTLELRRAALFYLINLEDKEGAEDLAVMGMNFFCPSSAKGSEKLLLVTRNDCGSAFKMVADVMDEVDAEGEQEIGVENHLQPAVVVPTLVHRLTYASTLSFEELVEVNQHNIAHCFTGMDVDASFDALASGADIHWNCMNEDLLAIGERLLSAEALQRRPIDKSIVILRRLVLDYGYNINRYNPICTILLTVDSTDRLAWAQQMNLPFLRAILELGGIDEVYDQPACLSKAVGMNLLSDTELLLQYGSDPNQPVGGGLNPLMLSRTKEATELLMKYGADVNSMVTYSIRVFRPDPTLPNQDETQTITTVSEESALHFAAQHDLSDVVDALTSKTSRVNLDARTRPHGHTPLMLCSTEDMAQLLLDRGANVEIRDAEGETALLHHIRYAAYHNDGDLSVIQLLLERGASPAYINAAGSPLFLTVWQMVFMGNMDVLMMLIEHGALEVVPTDLLMQMQAKSGEMQTSRPLHSALTRHLLFQQKRLAEST